MLVIREGVERLERFAAVDYEAQCFDCGEKFDGYAEYFQFGKFYQARIVMLHTLLDGSSPLRVMDLISNACTKMVCYEGGGDYLLSHTRTKLYTRELLDSRIAQISGMGVIFREAYMTWKFYSKSRSARKSRGSRTHNITRSTATMGSTNSYVCSRLVMDHLNSLFTCLNCE